MQPYEVLSVAPQEPFQNNELLCSSRLSKPPFQQHCMYIRSLTENSMHNVEEKQLHHTGAQLLLIIVMSSKKIEDTQ